MGTAGVVTLRVYDALPEVYRHADKGLGYPLLRWLDLLLAQLDDVEDLVDRFTYTPPDDGGTPGDTADLVDPATANAAWLPWLAQLLGVDVTGLTVAQRRALLAAPAEAWDHGTPAAIAEAAAKGLTGTQTVTITPHHGGNPYVIGVGTLTAETAEADTFAELKALAPRWADLEALGSYANAKAPAPIRAAEAERPAGYRLEHHYTDAP